MARQVLSQKAEHDTVGRTSERWGSQPHADIWKKTVPGWGNSKCKDPESALCLSHCKECLWLESCVGKGTKWQERKSEREEREVKAAGGTSLLEHVDGFLNFHKLYRPWCSGPPTALAASYPWNLSPSTALASRTHQNTSLRRGYLCLYRSLLHHLEHLQCLCRPGPSLSVSHLYPQLLIITGIHQALS